MRVPAIRLKEETLLSWKAGIDGRSPRRMQGFDRTVGHRWISDTFPWIIFVDCNLEAAQ
jgi:hypothetical protein